MAFTRYEVVENLALGGTKWLVMDVVTRTAIAACSDLSWSQDRAKVENARLGLESGFWRTAPNFPDYQVSAMGVRRSTGGQGAKKGRLMSLFDAGGYPHVRLSRDGKAYNIAVHRLICEAWYGPAPYGYECAHWDGNCLNFDPSNLRWATKKENEEDKGRHGVIARGDRSGRSRLSDKDAIRIIKLVDAGHSRSSVAKMFGISAGHAGRIASGKSRSHLQISQQGGE